MFNKIIDFFNDKIYLDKENRCDKNLLIVSNIIYLIIIYSLYKKNKLYYPNNLVILILLVSSVYHTLQCHHHNHKNIDFCYFMDILGCFISGFIIFCKFYDKINLTVVLLFILALYLFCKYETLTIYIYCHSFWHILTGIILYLILI